jgi:hypothetical protein
MFLLGDSEKAGDHEVEGGEGDQSEQAAPPVKEHWKGQRIILPTPPEITEIYAISCIESEQAAPPFKEHWKGQRVILPTPPEITEIYAVGCIESE